jgi:hypothetical protein
MMEPLKIPVKLLNLMATIQTTTALVLLCMKNRDTQLAEADMHTARS